MNKEVKSSKGEHYSAGGQESFNKKKTTTKEQKGFTTLVSLLYNQPLEKKTSYLKK